MANSGDPPRYMRALDLALQAAYKGDFEEALKQIEIIETLIHRVGVILVLKIFVLCGLKRYEDCMQTYSKALKKIDRTKSYNSDEKKYLMAYSADIARFALKQLGDSPVKILDVNLSDIDLDNVNIGYKIKFPLKEHPDWKDLKIT